MKHINILQLLAIAIVLLFIGCEQEIKPEQEIKEPISVVGISLSRSSVEMLEGDTFALTVTIEPSNADDQSVSWTSSQPAIASVQEGVITAHKAGNATITVKTTDGGLTVKCNVVVKEKAGVTLDKTSLELTEGDTEVLTATVYPSNAPNKNVYWTSSNPVIATVDNGKVTAMQEGTATITVTTEDGRHTATCEVKVLRIRVEGVYLDKDSIEMLEGSAITLSATITPENASNKNLIWTSSDETVATVDNGKVTAMQEGTATITVTTEDGGKTATCIVKVWGIPVEDISLDKTSIEMTEGDEIILTATITPENALNKNLIWTSSDETVATVDNGKVTAMQEGTATITVITEDGGKTATCEVKVKSIVVDGGIEGTEDWWYVK